MLKSDEFILLLSYQILVLDPMNLARPVDSARLLAIAQRQGT